MQAFEEQIAQLSFWKHNTQQRLLEFEQENGGLKQRLQHFFTEDDSGASICRIFRAHACVQKPGYRFSIVTQSHIKCTEPHPGCVPLQKLSRTL